MTEHEDRAQQALDRFIRRSEEIEAEHQKEIKRMDRIARIGWLIVAIAVASSLAYPLVLLALGGAAGHE